MSTQKHDLLPVLCEVHMSTTCPCHVTSTQPAPTPGNPPTRSSVVFGLLTHLDNTAVMAALRWQPASTGTRHERNSSRLLKLSSCVLPPSIQEHPGNHKTIRHEQQLVSLTAA
jgi:hypothetical protein